MAPTSTDKAQVTRAGSRKVASVTPADRDALAATSAVVTDYRGLTVRQLEDLRGTLRAEGIDYIVVKNTLARRAAVDSGAAGLRRRADRSGRPGDRLRRPLRSGAHPLRALPQHPDAAARRRARRGPGARRRRGPHPRRAAVARRAAQPSRRQRCSDRCPRSPQRSIRRTPRSRRPSRPTATSSPPTASPPPSIVYLRRSNGNQDTDPRGVRRRARRPGRSSTSSTP